MPPLLSAASQEPDGVFLKNRLMRDPLTRVGRFVPVSLVQRVIWRLSSDAKATNSGTITVSPDFKSPFHASITIHPLLQNKWVMFVGFNERC